MLRALRERHQVTYLTLDDGSAAPDAAEKASEYADTLIRIPFRSAPKRSARFWGELAMNLGSRLPYAVAKYKSPELTRAIRRVLQDGSVDVVVCDFLAPSLNVPDDLGVPTVLFQHNVEAEIWRRHFEVRSNPLTRRYLRQQWQRMERFERAECRRFDRVIAVSGQDATLMRTAYGVLDVAAVPTGVDTEYFSPARQVTREPGHLVFTGSMDWLPNEDGIRWFVSDILPRLKALVPGVTVTIVGRHPPEAIRAFARTDSSVRVTGTVPDVRPFIETAAGFIVPLRIGGGTRLKIFEAMAMECPVVSTTVGAEGLPVRDGEHLLLADSAEAFASAVAAVLLQPAEASRRAQAAAALVRRSHAWSRVAEEFAALCQPGHDSVTSPLTTRSE
jgi:glycosyltransferase involved in cell wall biosynthesis